MEKYEILSSDEETHVSRRRGISLTPFFVLLFIIITGGVGVFVTYEKISRKSIELGNCLTQVFIINEGINRINNILIDLVNRDKEYEKLIEKKLVTLKSLKNRTSTAKNLNYNYSSLIKTWDLKVTEGKKLLDETLKINDISIKETNKLFTTLSDFIKEYKSLTKIDSKILDSDSEYDLIENWIKGDKKFNYKIQKCFEFLNETLSFNDTLQKYYDKCIEGNKKENNSIVILYQTVYYNRIGAFIKNKGKYKEQTNFVFNLKNKIKYDIADNLIQISNTTFPSFGLENVQGPYDLRVFHSVNKNSIQINTTIIRENEVRNVDLLHIEIFLLS